MQELERVVTERLIGRRPVPGDADGYVGFFSHPDVPEAWWPARMRTPELARQMLERQIAHWDQHRFGLWTVLRGDTIVGRAGLAHTVADGRPEVELAWFIHPDHQQRGYATEMARRAVEAAFTTLALENVVAFTGEENVASQRVMDKLGMAYEKTFVHAGMPHVLMRLGRPAG